MAAEEARRKEEDARRQSEEKSKHLSVIHSHIQQRKAAMEAQRHLESLELDRLRQQTYATEKLLQDYHKRILLPIEQHRAEVLSRNKQLHKPLSREELELHAKRHDEELRVLAAHKSVERGGGGGRPRRGSAGPANLPSPSYPRPKKTFSTGKTPSQRSGKCLKSGKSTENS